MPGHYLGGRTPVTKLSRHMGKPNGISRLTKMMGKKNGMVGSEAVPMARKMAESIQSSAKRAGMAAQSAGRQVRQRR